MATINLVSTFVYNRQGSELRPNHLNTHRLRPIIVLDIKFNLHNRHLGKLTTNTAEELDDQSLEQYMIRRAKAADIQALNKNLL